jgi:hypothetical protein
MSDKGSNEQPQAGNSPANDLALLADRLREQARNAPDHIREEAVAAANKVHEHATSGNPDHRKMRFHLKGLETVAELTPTVNSILQALSNVGM